MPVSHPEMFINGILRRHQTKHFMPRKFILADSFRNSHFIKGRNDRILYDISRTIPILGQSSFIAFFLTHFDSLSVYSQNNQVGCALKYMRIEIKLNAILVRNSSVHDSSAHDTTDVIGNGKRVFSKDHSPGCLVQKAYVCYERTL